MSIGVIIGIVAIAVIAFVAFFVYLLSKEGSSLEGKNDEIRQEILKKGISGEAAVLEAESVGGTNFVGRGRTLVKVNFRIVLSDTGEEYDFSRRRLSVPLNIVADFRKGKTFPILVHKDNRTLLLFDFDQNCSADHKMFEDK